MAAAAPPFPAAATGFAAFFTRVFEVVFIALFRHVSTKFLDLVLTTVLSGISSKRRKLM
jgi:hypothetical protein